MVMPYIGDSFSIANGCLVSDWARSPLYMEVVNLCYNAFAVSVTIAGSVSPFLGFLICYYRCFPIWCYRAIILAPVVPCVIAYLIGAIYTLSILIFGFFWVGDCLFNTVAACFLISVLAQAIISYEYERRMIDGTAAWYTSMLRVLSAPPPQAAVQAQAGERAHERSLPISADLLINADDEQLANSSLPRKSVA